jgi:hypothetical protein
MHFTRYTTGYHTWNANIMTILNKSEKEILHNTTEKTEKNKPQETMMLSIN